MAHEFLSEGWFRAVDALGPPPADPGPFDGPLNLIVTRPGASDVEIHVDRGTVTRGRIAGAPTTVTTNVTVIRALLLEGDQHAAMQAFMAGEVEVEGDVGPLMAMGMTKPSHEHRAYVRSIRALTYDDRPSTRGEP